MVEHVLYSLAPTVVNCTIWQMKDAECATMRSDIIGDNNGIRRISAKIKSDRRWHGHW